MKDNMKIKQSFKIYGYNFELYASELMGYDKNKRKRYRAIYVAEENGKPVNIEVVVLREMPPQKQFGMTNTYIKYPSNSEWGTFGWTYKTLKSAYKKYNEIPSILAYSLQ